MNWQKELATCLKGKLSVWWDADWPKEDRLKNERLAADSLCPDEQACLHEQARLKVRFRQSDCAACQNRAKCVRTVSKR